MNVVTRSEVEQYLNISIERDTYEDRLISSVSDRLAAYCGRDEWGPAQERIEYCDGGTQMLILGVWPVVSVASIYDDPDHDWDEPCLLDASSYYAGNAGIIYSEVGRFLPGKESVRVTYTGGYASESEIPQAVKTAALMQYKNEYLTNQPAVQPQMFENREDEGLLPEATALLQKYKREIPF